MAAIVSVLGWQFAACRLQCHNLITNETSLLSEKLLMSPRDRLVREIFHQNVTAIFELIVRMRRIKAAGS